MLTGTAPCRGWLLASPCSWFTAPVLGAICLLLLVSPLDSWMSAGLDKQSAWTFKEPGKCLIFWVNSAIADRILHCLCDLGSKTLLRANVRGLWSAKILYAKICHLTCTENAWVLGPQLTTHGQMPSNWVKLPAVSLKRNPKAPRGSPQRSSAEGKDVCYGGVQKQKLNLLHQFWWPYCNWHCLDC